MSPEPHSATPEPSGDDLRETDALGPTAPRMPHVDHLSARERLDAILAHHARQWALHKRVRAKEYLDQYPGLHKDATAGAALLYQEYLFRGGDHSPDLLGDYLREYPAFADALGLLCGLGEVVEPMLSSPDSPAPARRFGDYELLEEVGRGGMGVVW